MILIDFLLLFLNNVFFLCIINEQFYLDNNSTE